MSNEFKIKSDGLRAVFTIAIALILLAPLAYLITIAVSDALENVDETTMVSDYNGWKSVTLGTDTPLKATLMIPDGYEFVNEDGWMYLKDTKTDKTVAYQAFRGERYFDYKNVTFGYRDTEYSELLPEELQDVHMFEEPKGEGSTKYNEIETGTGTVIAAVMEICYITETREAEMLVMVFDSGIMDGKEIRKMLKTYVWGGIVN